MSGVQCDLCDRVVKTPAGLKRHHRWKHPPGLDVHQYDPVEGAVFEATTAAVGAADHLLPQDGAAVAMLLRLARLIDGTTGEARSRLAADFLRFAESLGLTPVSRSKLDLPPADSGKTALEKARERWRLAPEKGADE